VREAGGFAVDMDGGPNVLASGNVIATNERLNDALRSLLASASAG
jgi:fructose-1,6-bisphosphatase/inositol monophosphatase family enzyme